MSTTTIYNWIRLQTQISIQEKLDGILSYKIDDLINRSIGKKLNYKIRIQIEAYNGFLWASTELIMDEVQRTHFYDQ